MYVWKLYRYLHFKTGGGEGGCIIIFYDMIESDEIVSVVL